RTPARHSLPLHDALPIYFEPLYTSLDTTLTRQDVRFLLRREVRGRAQDDRGAAFPEGDFEEDPMLQAGIRAALEKLGANVDEFPDRKSTRLNSSHQIISY